MAQERLKAGERRNEIMNDIAGVKILNMVYMQRYIKELIDIDNRLVKKIGNTYSVESWNSENFLFNLSYKWDISQIYIENNKAKGAVIVSNYAEGLIHINRFFVDIKCQGKYIGQTLNCKLLNCAKKFNMKAITLFVNSENIKAIKFYEKNGYSKLEGKVLADIMQRKGKINFQYDCFYDDYNIKYFAYQFKL